MRLASIAALIGFFLTCAWLARTPAGTGVLVARAGETVTDEAPGAPTLAGALAHLRREPYEGTRVQETVPDVAPALLHVLDAATDEELHGIRLVAAVGPGRQRHPGPRGAQRVLANDTRSPVHLAPGASGGLWVGAPGYAWQVIDVSGIEGDSPSTVRLAPGGDLEVRVAGQRAGEDLALEVFASPGTDANELLARVQPLSEDVAVLEGLPTGQCELRVLEPERGLQLATATADLHPGLSTPVILELPRDRPALGGFACRLTLPDVPLDDEILSSLRIVIRSSDHAAGARGVRRQVHVRSMSRGPSASAAWTYEEQGLWAGDYVLEVAPLGATVEARVRPGIVTRVDLAPTELAYALLTIAEAGMADGLRVARLDARLGPRRVKARFDADIGAYRLTSVPGPLAVHFSDPGFGTYRVELETQPGWNDWRVEVRRVTPIRITLDGPSELVVDPAWWFAVEVQALDPGTRVGGRRVARTTPDAPSEHAAIVNVSGAGRYALAFPPLEGWAQIVPKELVVTAGEPARISVAVRRPPGPGER